MDKGERRKGLVKAALREANGDKKGFLRNVWFKLKLCKEMIKDVKARRYKSYPTGSILMLIIGAAYFFSPFDIIPDWLLGFGFLDDATVIGIVFRQINKDLIKYEKWKKANTEDIL